MLSTSAEDLQKAFDLFNKDAPDSLTSQFTERKSKAEAVAYQNQRKSNIIQLYPPGVYNKSLFCHNAVAFNLALQE